MISPAGHKCEHQRFPPRALPDLQSQRVTSEIRHAEKITVHIFATPQQSHGVLAGTCQSHRFDIIGVVSGRRETLKLSSMTRKGAELDIMCNFEARAWGDKDEMNMFAWRYEHICVEMK